MWGGHDIRGLTFLPREAHMTPFVPVEPALDTQWDKPAAPKFLQLKPCFRTQFDSPRYTHIPSPDRMK
jgi:hypothetical protein